MVTTRANNEYNSLRAEQISRIEAMYSMAAGAIDVFGLAKKLDILYLN